MRISNPSLLALATAGTALALVACGDSSTPRPVPTEEPSEAAIVKILERQYKAINRNGGMPVTVTASGKSLVLKPKIWEAHKDGCKPVPREPPGNYECSLNLMVTMLEGDDRPGQHAERVYVSWDETEGEWVGTEVLEERRKQQD